MIRLFNGYKEDQKKCWKAFAASVLALTLCIALHAPLTIVLLLTLAMVVSFGLVLLCEWNIQVKKHYE